jgi:hypothetical protein
MSKTNLVFLNIMTYLKGRITPIIILLIAGLYMWGEYLTLKNESVEKIAEDSCEIECLPKAGHLISLSNKQTCWCFENEDTLIKQ